jgi:hydrogenase-4 component E
VGARREAEPYIGFGMSVVLGVLAFGLAFLLTSFLPSPPDVRSSLIVPVALSLCFIGLLFLVTRKKAIGQVVGYLVLENGIFIFSLGLAHALPIAIEMGILLDVFVGAMVMGITVNSINREFDHIDATRLQALHDLPSPRELAARRRMERR